MELTQNQSALILEINDDGEIFVEVASSDHEGVTALLCQAIAKKLLADENFSSDLMGMIEDGQ
jgi:hypothetical protein